MAATPIPFQPIKFWDAFETAQLECEKFSKPFCLKFKDTDTIRLLVSDPSRSGSQLFSNSDFTSALTGWSQADGDGTTPVAWTDTTCETSDVVTTLSTGDTKWLYQSIEVDSDKCYRACVALCSASPAGLPDDTVEIGYSSDGGSTWTVLASQTGFINNETLCFDLDLSALGSPPYEIGLRFTDSVFVDSFTLTEYDCTIDIVDCDCETVIDSISSSSYDETSGQYLYEFDANSLGLADGVYRLKSDDLGCSSCFEIDSNLGCNYWLFKIGGNSSSAFGIDWSLFGAGEYIQLRIANPEKRIASYEDLESETYRDSSFVNKLVYFNRTKRFTLTLPQIPEHIHDVFAILASGSEYFSITIDGNEKRFRIIPESYELTTNLNSDLANAKLTIVEYEENSMINQNTANMS